jgi:tol-pal system protein YbgF
MICLHRQWRTTEMGLQHGMMGDWVRPSLCGLMLAMLVAWAPAARAQDAAELTVRVNRLENQLRQLSGQIEQLQFENRRLTEQLRRFQEDVEFRLNERGGATARPAPNANAAQPATPRPRRGDAFEPDAQPGQPGQPLDLGGGGRPTPQAPLSPGQGAANATPRNGASVAATTAASPRDAYNAALALMSDRQFEQAELGFRQFLQSYPRDRLVPSATYQLGESYFRRSRHREAAEQFLKVTTDHGQSPVAPDAMLRLGMSLSALGARDQACATFAQVRVRYPQANAGVVQGVERERRRARCDG